LAVFWWYLFSQYYVLATALRNILINSNLSLVLREGTWFSLGGTISDIMTKEVISTTASTGGGVSNVVNIHQGKADLGLSAALLGMPAKRGEEPFKSPLPNTYCLANLYKQYFYFIVGQIMRKNMASRRWRMCLIKNFQSGWLL
jgi:hypothetical protein